MCRLLGVVASEPARFRLTLREAPRSLAVLSREHRDGWGVGVFSASAGWSVQRGTLSAHEDDDFHEVAAGSRGEVLVAHVRKRTVGAVTLDNTHPFRHGRWVFAHNGTLEDVAWVKDRTPLDRLAQVRGETDSELLFAWVLTALDEAGVTGEPATDRTDAALRTLARAGRDHPEFGAFTFLLSDGITTYAHRFGRSLFLLERGPDDAVRARRTSRDGTVVETPWSGRRSAVFVASERITDEPWQDIDNGTLLRIERLPSPSYRLVAA